MLRWRKRIRKTIYIITDIICMQVAFVITNILHENILEKTLYLSNLEKISFIMLFVIFQIIVYLTIGVYDDTMEASGVVYAKTVVKMLIALFINGILLGAIMFYVHIPLSREFILEYTLIVIGFTVVNRIILEKLTNGKNNEIRSKKILLVGHSIRGRRYIEEISKYEYLNIKIIGYVTIKENKSYIGVKSLGNINDLLEIATEHVVDEIAVAKSLIYDSRMSGALRVCQNMGITITMLLETHNSNTKAHVAMVGNLPVLKFHTVSLNENQLFAKRVLDVIGGIVGMILFGIAYIIVGPIIKIDSPGPIIFKQNRVGMNGRIFQVWKFRSMSNNAEKQKAALMNQNEMQGHMFKMTNDPRVTKIGEFIRKTSIDELPQFYNVLKGDMSLVGTRPPTVKEVEAYELHHLKRISITPGITGKWQISGRSDIEEFEEVIRLDEEYIKDWTIWKDIMILLKTVKVVLNRKGSK